ncbi:DUF1205 domain-containing protein [Nocardiopsis rhodophaea]|uniref:DUF1205 domain-containing protein n=2 Tax=Nocardiopsis rhodophaea TaxID=280238 RepID=A0ABN2THW3_9ACTN
MRVLFSAVLQPSHYFPLVPLGWALRGAGHEVRVAHQPALTRYVRESGLASVVVGSDMRIDPKLRGKAKESQDSWERHGRGAGTSGNASRRPAQEGQNHHNRIAFSLFADATERMAPDLIDFARYWKPDLIVFDWQCYAAHLAAEVLGIPSVRHQSAGPDYAAGIAGWRDLEKETLGDIYRKHGIDGVEPEGRFTIDPCPPSLQYELPSARRYLPTRFVPYNGNGRVEDWMWQRSWKPRVALTVGGAYFWMMGSLDPVRRFIDLLANRDVEIIAPVPQGGAETLGDVGLDVRIVENLPLELFLPSCDLIINHGGSGTVGTAVANGVPQIISPPTSMGDPPFHNAERIAGAGAGAEVDIFTDSTEEVRAAVEAVITTSSYRAAAGRLAVEVLTRPAPAALVGDLEDAALG